MTQTTPIPVAASTAEQAQRRGFRWLYIVLGIFLLAAGTYAIAWTERYT
jgi:hypothetical protein